LDPFLSFANVGYPVSKMPPRAAFNPINVWGIIT